MTDKIGTIEMALNGKKCVKTTNCCHICGAEIYIYDLPKHLENCPEGMPVYALLYPMPTGAAQDADGKRSEEM